MNYSVNKILRRILPLAVMTVPVTLLVLSACGGGSGGGSSSSVSSGSGLL